MSKNYKTQEKHTAERFFWQFKFKDTETHAATYTTFSKRSEVKIYYMKTLCFASIVEFIAARPLWSHGSAIKIMLCHGLSCSEHKQPASWVNFGSQNITKP